jgi:hypothetical protein
MGVLTVAEPSLALQKLIRARLIDSDELTELVDEAAVIDRSGRPEVFPCVIIGDGNTVFDDFHAVAHADLHVWAEEPGLVQAKEIGAAVIGALEDCPWHAPGWFVSDLSVRSARYLRDPSGQHSHGVISYAAVMQKRAA